MEKIMKIIMVKFFPKEPRDKRDIGEVLEGLVDSGDMEIDNKKRQEDELKKISENQTQEMGNAIMHAVSEAVEATVRNTMRAQGSALERMDSIHRVQGGTQYNGNIVSIPSSTLPVLILCHCMSCFFCQKETKNPTNHMCHNFTKRHNLCLCLITSLRGRNRVHI